MKPKSQRLVLAALAVIALMGAAALALSGLEGRVSFFVTPQDLAQAPARGDALRLGGMVQENSIVSGPDGVSITFVVEDETTSVPVAYRGITPDLFREGSGVVAEGRWDGDRFAADTILAKHDERYMPPPLDNPEAAAKTVEE